MSNWTIEKKIIGSLGVSVALTIAACISGLIGSHSAGASLGNAASAAQALESMNAMMWTLLFASICVSAGVGYFVIRTINRKLRTAANDLRASSHQVVSASSQVASASQNLAQGTSQQAATLEETSASGHEISTLTARNAENSKVAADLMAEVDQRVKQANRKLEEMVASMDEINNSSDRIAKIIKVIDGIAFQTNILALNAAVEAARAGEAGMGFAVVADEVRNLAQRCAQAARDTTALIDGSVQSAQAGSACLDEVAKVIRGITDGAVKAKTLVDEVSQGGQEQARGMDQMSRALAQMEQTTQQAAANAQESASASQELKVQARSIEEIVFQLEHMVSEKQMAAKSSATERQPKKKAIPVSNAAGMIALQRSVGTNRQVKVNPTQIAAKVGAKNSASFPLDESEFREF